MFFPYLTLTFQKEMLQNIVIKFIYNPESFATFEKFCNNNRKHITTKDNALYNPYFNQKGHNAANLPVFSIKQFL